jgi:hypothetical protein
MEEKRKREYKAPSVRRVRLDIRQSVLGFCQQTPDWIINPICDLPGSGCPTPP